MSDKTFYTTTEDIRTMQSEESKKHGGEIPKGSDAAIMQQIVSENTDKAAEIDRVKANLPLPEDPPKPSDWNSMDASKTEAKGVNVKLGTGGSDGLREPATGTSEVRVAGGPFDPAVAPLNDDMDRKLVKKKGNYKDPSDVSGEP